MSNTIRHLIIQTRCSIIQWMPIIQQEKKKHGAISTLHFLLKLEKNKFIKDEKETT